MKVKNLKKSFSHKLLFEINFHLKENNIYVLLGRNGAGKTTIMKILSDLMEYDSGLIEKQEKKTFFVSETPFFLEYLSGYNNLKLICEIHNISQERLDEYIEKKSIKDFADDLVINYSHGMRHQLSLASAFLINPDVLLLDEPLTSLDPINIEVFKNELKDYAAQNKIIIVSTHILPIAHQLANEILLLSNQKIVQLKNNFSEEELVQYITKQL